MKILVRVIEGSNYWESTVHVFISIILAPEVGAFSEYLE